MTNLSPAAQAVLDAANNSSAYGPEDCLNEARQIAAAALRAAAIHLRSDEYVICNGSSYAMMIEVDDLLDLATELETQ
jgi:DNA-binding transcriptional MocR family regulator